MLLDFENMEETVIHNFNGGEKDTRAKMYNDENMRILYGVLSREHLLVFMSIQTTAKKSFVFQARLQFILMEKQKF